MQYQSLCPYIYGLSNLWQRTEVTSWKQQYLCIPLLKVLVTPQIQGLTMDSPYSYNDGIIYPQSTRSGVFWFFCCWWGFLFAGLSISMAGGLELVDHSGPLQPRPFCDSGTGAVLSSLVWHFSLIAPAQLLTYLNRYFLKLVSIWLLGSPTQAAGSNNFLWDPAAAGNLMNFSFPPLLCPLAITLAQRSNTYCKEAHF